MVKYIQKVFIHSIIIIIFIMSMTSSVYAAEPYKSYNATEWSTDAASPDAYKAVKSYTGYSLGAGHFKEPQDMYIDHENNIYILDSGNNRVLMFDKDFKLLKEIKQLKTKEGADDSLSKPMGMFVDHDRNIYVADTGHSRCIKMDQTGQILQEYVKPTVDIYTSETYVPKKVLADKSGMVYILSESIFQGALLYKQDGSFVSFFGSPKVQISARLLFDRFWKKILSREIKDKMARYVPVEFSNFDIDPKGFVYTCSMYTNNNMEQIRKLNFLGNNIFRGDRNYGEKDIVGYKTKILTTGFFDLCVDENYFLYALDITRNRIYVFDQEMNRLMTLGTIGEQLGAFNTPVAVDTMEGKVLVLDARKCNITVFEPTQYGQYIKEAVILYQQGKYAEAMEPWKEVLKMNGNYEMAYNGMGRAMDRAGDYASAVAFFRLGYDREGESKAFLKYRDGIVRENIILVVSMIFIIIIALLVLTSRKSRQQHLKSRGVSR